MGKPCVSCCILTLVLCLISASSGWGAGSDYSNWTRDLSGLTDTPDYAWNDYDFKMAVSGQNVHVVWLAARTDGGGNRLSYRRSTDGGKTFDAVKIVATGIDSDSFSAEWQGLAVDENTVHVVYKSGWPSTLKYLRSTDNGANFEPVKDIHATGYSSYSGVYMVAANGVVTVALAANKEVNAGGHKDVVCIYSNDGGASFASTTIAHSDLSQTVWIYGFRVGDMIRSGANIYILYTVVDVNDSASQAHLYLVSSNNGGVAFNPPQRVNVASTNGGYYTNPIQNQHYSPKLATVGNNVYVTWVNTEVQNFYQPGSTYTLRVRRSTDRGLSLEAPVTLTPQPVSSSVLTGGQETVVASGNNVYVVTSYNSGGTSLWRSTDSGSSFETPRKISDGGWWPTLLIDPNNSAKLHLANGYYVTSADSGASFKGVLSLPPNTLGEWYAPVLAVDTDGVIHYAATRSRYDNSTPLDIYYRRLAPAPAATGTPEVLHLVTDSIYRRDNLQVAASPDINLTSALTIEYWVKMDLQGDGNNWSHFQIEVAKKRASGYGSYELGYWDKWTGFYGRLVTENSASQHYGDFIGTAIVPQDLTWYHVAMTYDASAGADNWKYYVNGELATSATLTGNIVMDYLPLVLGPDTSNTNGTLEFSDFRIWNRARSAAEIMTDMNRTLNGTESGLNAYYTFADTTRDMTGHGNDGVLMFKETFVSSPIPSRIKQLTLAFAGSGGGQVNGDMPCVSGEVCAPVVFPYDSRLALFATPDTNSTFGNWSGCTSVVDRTCNVTMDVAKSVTVTLVAAPPVKILGGSADGYATLRSAYDAVPESPVSTIQLRSITLPDPPITFDRPVNVIIKGGFNAAFTPPNSGITIIQGPAIFKGGTVTVEQLSIK